MAGHAERLPRSATCRTTKNSHEIWKNFVDSPETPVPRMQPLLGWSSEYAAGRLHWRDRRLSRRRARLDVGDLLDELGSHSSLVSVWECPAPIRSSSQAGVGFDGSLQEQTVSAADEVDRTLFSLRAAAHLGHVGAEAMMSTIDPALAHLQEQLLGQALEAIDDGPVVLVPPARLNSAPWGAMPGLRDRVVSVAPSAKAWLRAKRTTPPRGGHVALIGGPDLRTDAAEVPALAAIYPEATVLVGERAHSSAVLEAVNGARLAHIGAHGTFRDDNPMFSALELSDGPLTLYDVERVRRPPHRLVLSACESAVGAPTGADELLGLANSLVALGTAGLLASVVPVNDEAVVPFSLVVHKHLEGGASLAAALCEARRAAQGDPLATATAYAFLALGRARLAASSRTSGVEATVAATRLEPLRVGRPPPGVRVCGGERRAETSHAAAYGVSDP